MQQCSSFFAMSYCQLILSLARMQAVVFRLPSCRPRAGPPSSARPPSCRLSADKLLLDAVRFTNPSKSTLAHDAVAAAVLHKHHPIIRVGVDLIQFVYESRSHLGNGGYL